KFRQAPSKQVTGQLIAYSTDGTLARRAITLGKALAEVAADAKVGYPKSLNFGIVDTGDSASIKVPGLPGDQQVQTQVGDVSGPGVAVPVTRRGDTIELAKLPKSGEYSGTVDLTP